MLGFFLFWILCSLIATLVTLARNDVLLCHCEGLPEAINRQRIPQQKARAKHGEAALLIPQSLNLPLLIFSNVPATARNVSIRAKGNYGDAALWSAT
ncbi:MAG: hypothetical protein K2N70_08550 [Helicobacter sp.]|nr:hypothetical protein [Helicobacter sp.]